MIWRFDVASRPTIYGRTFQDLSLAISSALFLQVIFLCTGSTSRVTSSLSHGLDVLFRVQILFYQARHQQWCVESHTVRSIAVTSLVFNTLSKTLELSIYIKRFRKKTQAPIPDFILGPTVNIFESCHNSPMISVFPVRKRTVGNAVTNIISTIVIFILLKYLHTNITALQSS